MDMIHLLKVSPETRKTIKEQAIRLHNKGKKSECKAIAAFVDEQFAALGFTRTYLNPVPNMDDATIYRMTGRWIATVGSDNTVYRR